MDLAKCQVLFLVQKPSRSYFISLCKFFLSLQYFLFHLIMICFIEHQSSFFLFVLIQCQYKLVFIILVSSKIDCIAKAVKKKIVTIKMKSIVNTAFMFWHIRSFDFLHSSFFVCQPYLNDIFPTIKQGVWRSLFNLSKS